MGRALNSKIILPGNELLVANLFKSFFNRSDFSFHFCVFEIHHLEVMSFIIFLSLPNSFFRMGGYHDGGGRLIAVAMTATIEMGTGPSLRRATPSIDGRPLELRAHQSKNGKFRKSEMLKKSSVRNVCYSSFSRIESETRAYARSFIEQIPPGPKNIHTLR